MFRQMNRFIDSLEKLYQKINITVIYRNSIWLFFQQLVVFGEFNFAELLIIETVIFSASSFKITKCYGFYKSIFKRIDFVAHAIIPLCEAGDV